MKKIPVVGYVYYDVRRQNKFLFSFILLVGDNLLHYGLSKMVDESEIWNITFQILEALNYLHSNQIRHFDVKRKLFYRNMYSLILSYMLKDLRSDQISYIINFVGVHEYIVIIFCVYNM